MRLAPARHDRGFTLFEALLASALLASAIVAVTLPMTVSAGNRLVETRLAMATGLAQEMMEEILAKPFDDPDGASSPGPEIGESTRDQFDNIDDYDGYAEAAGSLVAWSGEPVTADAAEMLSREVAVAQVRVAGQSDSEATSFVRVTVTVRDDTRAMATLTRLVYDTE